MARRREVDAVALYTEPGALPYEHAEINDYSILEIESVIDDNPGFLEYHPRWYGSPAPEPLYPGHSSEAFDFQFAGPPLRIGWTFATHLDLNTFDGVEYGDTNAEQILLGHPTVYYRGAGLAVAAQGIIEAAANDGVSTPIPNLGIPRGIYG